MDHEVDAFRREPVAGREVVPNLLDESPPVVGHVAAATADQVELLVGVGDFPVSLAVLQTDFLHEPEPRQEGERAIDAGDVEAGHRLGDALVDLFGREVTLGLTQRLPHETTLWGQPVALVAEEMGDVHIPHRTLRCMVRIETAATLDQGLLDEVEALLDTVHDAEGAHPLGERKRMQLTAGARGWTGVLAREGDRLVGYGHLRWRNPSQVAAPDTPGRPAATVEVAVHPERSDPGAVTETLLAEVRAVVGRAGGGLLHVWAHRVQQPGHTNVAEAGFSLDRVLAVMSRDLAERPKVPEPPEGVALRSYRPDRDDEQLLRVNNLAFAGHPEQGSWDTTTLAERRALGWFDPAGVVLAWRGTELLGFHWTKRHAPGSGEASLVTAGQETPVGEVYILAVHPDAQGLGLGRLLLSAGLAHLHDRGCRVAMLYADTADENATALYQSSGFEARHYEVCYADRVPAAPVSD